MSAVRERPVPKPRDMVLLPSGRVGMVVAVLPHHLREVQYHDLEGGTVVLHADLLQVRVPAIPRLWQEKIKP